MKIKNENVVLKYKNKKLELSSSDIDIIEKRVPEIKGIFSFFGKNDVKELVAALYNFANYPHFQVRPSFFEGIEV